MVTERSVSYTCHAVRDLNMRSGALIFTQDAVRSGLIAFFFQKGDQLIAVFFADLSGRCSKHYTQRNRPQITSFRGNHLHLCFFRKMYLIHAVDPPDNIQVLFQGFPVICEDTD